MPSSENWMSEPLSVIDSLFGTRRDADTLLRPRIKCGLLVAKVRMGILLGRLVVARVSVCSCVGLGFRIGLGNRVRVRNRV